MKLEFVELAGFRGFRDKVRFDFPTGFVVLSGRNGTGKSTLLDAIDFAITGTINKFVVTEARGGGLDEHIWWVGSGKAEEHYVSVGFIDEDGRSFVVTNSRERGRDLAAEDIAGQLCDSGAAAHVSIETLMKTTLIRDELIAGLSLDLPEQARFAAVRAAIGGMVGPDYSARTGEILRAASGARDGQRRRLQQLQDELGRMLGALTEARSTAERSADISEALRILESLAVSLPPALGDRLEAIRNLIAEKRRVLQEIETARERSVGLLPELAYFASQAGQAETKAAQVAVEHAVRTRELADRSLAAAIQVDTVERESDQYAAHIAALLEHGTAAGLQDGHCPLCAASRTPEEFNAAVESAKARLAAHGERLAASAAAVAQARSAASDAANALNVAEQGCAELERRRQALERHIASVREIYSRHNFDAPVDDPTRTRELLLQEQETLVKLERALFILEASSAVDRVTTLESRIATLRGQIDHENTRSADAEKAVEAARQIDTSAKTVANEILTEQFDTVMPLLKELYRRLRPHGDWRDIDAEFGGRVRASLNFLVEGGRNPQFLFSSGQRRATGLAFLLAIHLSRQWCRWQSLLLDDPVQHIDDYRALHLVEVLAAIRRTGRQVVVAVEDPALADVLCRRLRSSIGEFGRRFDLQTSTTGTAEVANMQDIYPMPREVLRLARAS